jgi:hypothetical protein
MNVRLKNLPRLRLADLLRRRKMTLGQFVKELGITSYGALCERCGALGVAQPTEKEYGQVAPIATSQQDGVIVLEPIPFTDDLTGRTIDPDAPVIAPTIEVVTDEVSFRFDEQTIEEKETKKRRKKIAES